MIKLLYVNGEYRDDTPIGKLMHDFSCEKPNDMNYEILAERARYFKENKEGREIMCRAFEEVREQALQEGALNEKLNSVKNLMDTLSLSLEEAIAALKVTDSEKEYILENLDKQRKLSRSLSQTMIAEYKTKLIEKSILQRKLAELYDMAEEEAKNSQHD